MSSQVMTIDVTHAAFPAALRAGALAAPCPRLWAIGSLDLLETRLLGFFCATRCSGNVILRTYDLAQALRAANIPVVGGFHTPMEQECLDLLLRGNQPVVICPARSIAHMRLPVAWRQALADNRLLVLSPFAPQHRRPTAALAEQRNRYVVTLADDVFVAHAPSGSKTARLCAEIMGQSKRLYTLDVAENASLIQRGAVGGSVRGLINLVTQC